MSLGDLLGSLFQILCQNNLTNWKNFWPLEIPSKIEEFPQNPKDSTFQLGEGSSGPMDPLSFSYGEKQAIPRFSHQIHHFPRRSQLNISCFLGLFPPVRCKFTMPNANPKFVHLNLNHYICDKNQLHLKVHMHLHEPSHSMNYLPPFFCIHNRKSLKLNAMHRKNVVIHLKMIIVVPLKRNIIIFQRMLSIHLL